MNESNSYMEVGKAMYARDKEQSAVPCWLIFDDRYRKRYAHLRSRPGQFPRQAARSGMLKQAWTLHDLARLCEIDPAGLSETRRALQPEARNGLDPEFGRGRVRLQPRARRSQPPGAPVPRTDRRPPYYAVQVLPGDIGTCGGLLTDEDARVLDQDDNPIHGLYATGNVTATVMGRHYFGPGASIANTMVFGYLAARHATRVVPSDMR